MARRLRRRPPDRPGAAVPGPARRRPDLLQPGPAVRARCRRCAACSARRRPAGRTSRRSATSCSWSTATPRCTSARRGWPRWSSARSPRWRRWAGRGCTCRSRAAPTTSAIDDHDAIDQARAYLTYFPRSWRHDPPVYESRAARGRADRRRRAGRRAGAVRHARGHRRHRRPAQLLRDQAAVRPRADRRAGPARRPPGRRRRQQLGPPRRHAVRRLGRQGGPLHLVLRRLQHPARLPRRRARVHDRLGGRAPGDHPPRGEDGHGGQRGDGAEGLGDRAQGVRRRAVRDVRPGVRARRDDRPADGPHRRDGPGGGDQRRVRQQDRRDRRPRRARRSSSPSSGRSTRPTSTCCAWRPSS